MNSRERIKKIISGEKADRCGFWLGHPDGKTWEIFYKHFGTTSQEEIRQILKCDFRWIAPWSAYKHPEKIAMFGHSIKKGAHKKVAHGDPGPLVDCEEISDLDEFEWPSTEHLDFTDVLEKLDNAGDYYRASGLWTPFYHNMMDLLGMEEYMVKMITHPDLIKEITHRVCQFYYDANKMLFEQAGTRIDGFFFGNDFGTQRDIICGPNQFDEHILPWFKKFTNLAHNNGYQVILHSCGSIHKVIGRLIESGVDCLHPLQAKASNMEAERLSKDFGGKISFLGGIDTQELLIHGTTEEIKCDVNRVIRELGPRLIVSPSHEAVLPDIPPENIVAMSEAATA